MIFFKQRKPRSFDYQPIYYNEIEDKRKQKEAKRKQEENGKVDYEQRIRGEFRKTLNDNREYRRTMEKRATMRVFLIIAILLTITYFLIR